MADVAAALRSWSVTPGSNSPTTSTVVGAGLSGNLQQIQATIRQYLASIGSSVICSATTDLSTVDGYTIPLSGNSTVTSFGTEQAGISYRLQFSGTPLLKNSTAIQCPVSADLQIAANDIITVTSQGSGNWKVSPEAIATGKYSAIDTGSTGSLSLKTNNGTTGFTVRNIASGVNFLSAQSGTTGNPALLGPVDSSDANVGVQIYSKGTGTISFFTDTAAVEQVRIVRTAGAANALTLTGGTNPTISTTAGSLAITPAVVMASTLTVAGATLQVGTNPSAQNGVNIAYQSGFSSRNSTNAGDITLASLATINSVVNIAFYGSGAVGTQFTSRSKAGAPTTSDINPGEWTVWRDTTGATTKLYYNNAGALMSVALA